MLSGRAILKLGQCGNYGSHNEGGGKTGGRLYGDGIARALNKTHYISPETSRRVLEVVNQLQYRKNVRARRLATGQSNLFGLVISQIANPYFPELIKGFQAAASERGYDVLLLNTEYNPERTKLIVKKLIESDVRGGRDDDGVG